MLIVPCSESIALQYGDPNGYYELRGATTWAAGNAGFEITGVDNSIVLPWLEGRAYAVYDLVLKDGYRFRCTVAHTSCGTDNYEPLVSPNWTHRWVQETF